MDYLNYLSGNRLRIPDLSKLWSGSEDVTDAKEEEEKGLIQRLEWHLIRAQVGKRVLI